MSLRIVRGQWPTHPITQLAYKAVRKSFQFGRVTLEIEHLADVEVAIDSVFAWLKAQNLGDDEIEHLAPYFGAIWPSAVALAEWIAREGERSRLQGKRVLEIGCGLAVPSLVAVHYGASAVLSDSHPDVPRFLTTNIKLNGDPQIDYIVADCDGEMGSTESFDYIIGSDILYEQQHVAIFSAILDRYADRQTKIVIADPGRAYIQKFVNSMNQLKWGENLAPWTVRHCGRDQDIYMLTFERI